MAAGWKYNRAMRNRGRVLALALQGLLCACALSRGRSSSQAAASSDPYGPIDAHALAAPAEARRSVAGLAAFLTTPATNEREKARAIYRWITANVTYAPSDAFHVAAADPSPEAVLTRGTAVCSGYTDLFTTLARAAGLEAQSIEGYGKGYAFRAGERFSGPSNHAWNAVKIDGEWQLIDCTWGAGSVEDGVYVQRFNSFYFLTPPRAFVWLHFPLDPRWQLLEQPLTLAEFEALPLVRDPFFAYSLELLSHTEAVVVPTARRTTIRIASPADVLVTARERCGKAAGRRPGPKVASQAGVHRIAIEAPRSGECALRVFAVRASERTRHEVVYHWAVEYLVLPAAVTE